MTDPYSMECVRVIRDSQLEKPKDRGHLASSKTLLGQAPSFLMLPNRAQLKPPVRISGAPED